MKKQELSKETEQMIIIGIGLFVILGITFSLTLEVVQDREVELNNYCVEKGYNELTDSYVIFGKWRVECDNIVLPEYLEIIKIKTNCLNLDKWGNCLEYGKKLWLREVRK